MLKLFSAKEARERTQAQIQRDILRNQEVQKVTRESESNLSKMEADFAESMAKLKEKRAIEEEKHSIRKNAMEQEISMLEKRKEQALIPIELEKVRADTMLKDAEKTLLDAEIKELEAENLKSILMERLEDVSDRESAVSDEETRLIGERDSIKNEREVTAKNTKNLSDSIERFNLHVANEDRRLNAKETDLILRERSADAKEDLIKRMEAQLQADSIRIKDARATLERAFERIGKKPSWQMQKETETEQPPL